MASSPSGGTVAGARGILTPFLLVLNVLSLAILVSVLGGAPIRTLEEILLAFAAAAFVLGWGAVLVWAVSYRVWATPTHLVIKSLGRVEAVRWEHVLSVTHVFQPKLPSWLLIRTGYGAGGRVFRLVHELFPNWDHLHAAITERARQANPQANPAAGIQAYGPVRAPQGRRAARTLPPPPNLERFELRAERRDAIIRLRLTWRARLLALVGVALALLGLAHVGLSVPRWLASGGGPGAGGFALFVAELSLGPLMGVMGLYVLSSAVRVTPAGATVRAWGLAERAVAWSDLRLPDWPGARGLAVLSPHSARDGGAIATLFDRRAVVVYLGSYENEGLLFDPPAGPKPAATEARARDPLRSPSDRRTPLRRGPRARRASRAP